MKFRCPHRPWKTDGSEGAKSRDEKAAARRKLYDAPADTEWTRVDEQFNANKVQSKKVNGRVVEHRPYEHETGVRWEAIVRCPDCGDEILVSTDQDPTATQPIAEPTSEA